MENAFTRVILSGQRRLVVLIFVYLLALVFPVFAQNPSPEALIPLNRVLQENAPAFYQQPGYYFLVLPGIVFFISVFLSQKIKIKKTLIAIFISLPLMFLLSAPIPQEDVLKKAYAFYDQGQYKEAGEQFVAAIEHFPYSKSLRLNTALAFYQAKQIGKAVGYLHRVLKMDPFDYKAYNYLTSWEKNYKFFAMKKKIPFTIMDFLFWFLIIVINLIFIFAGIYYLRQQGIWLILVITSVALFLIVSILFGVTLAQTYEELAVLVEREGDLKRIPIKEASSWVTLREGTVFKVLGKEQDLVLVETDLDLKGWIDESLLEFLK